MADRHRTGSVKFSSIQEALAKLMPHLAPTFIDKIPYAYYMSPSDILSREEYEALFDPRSRIKSGKSRGYERSADKRDGVRFQESNERPSTG
jgi:hypothetical protein